MTIVSAPGFTEVGQSCIVKCNDVKTTNWSSAGNDVEPRFQQQRAEKMPKAWATDSHSMVVTTEH
eukprot:4186189-Amphidinium_carterae.1